MVSSTRRTKTTPPGRSPADLARRAEANEEARASLRLEGLAIDDVAEAVMDRWVRGEITGDEAVQEMMLRLPLP